MRMALARRHSRRSRARPAISSSARAVARGAPSDGSQPRASGRAEVTEGQRSAHFGRGRVPYLSSGSGRQQEMNISIETTSTTITQSVTVTLWRSCFQRLQGVNDRPVARAHSADGDQLVDRVPRQVAVNDGGHHHLVQRDRAFVIIEERRVGGVATGGYAHQGLPRR
jgi:hypothetical protein